MKSTLVNMVCVLGGITLIASAGVGAVNMITAEPIEEAKAAAVTEALRNVMPPFDEVKSEVETADDLEVTVYTATTGGAVSGYAVETLTNKGFGGAIRMMVGFLPSGEIYNVNVLEHAETPGLGSKMCDEGNPLLASIKGKAVDSALKVTKDGGTVDALTAATISSRAYVDAVNRACSALQRVRGNDAAFDSASGATSVDNIGGDDNE